MAKFRHGFVSNSSSSSFLLIAPTGVHDRVYKTLSPYQKAVVDAMMGTEVVLGTKCVTGGYLMTQDYGPFEYIDIEFDGDTEDGPAEAFDAYVYEMKQTSQVYISRLDG